MIAKSPVILFLVLAILLVSCQDLDKTSKPDNLIPEDKMVEVLTELSLVQAARNYNKYKLEQIGIEPSTYVFEKYDIDSLQFARSSDYYADQYVIYERIYDSVRMRIQVMKSRYDALSEFEIKQEDSVKRLQKDSKTEDSLTPMERLISKQPSQKGREDQLEDKGLIPPVEMGREQFPD